MLQLETTTDLQRLIDDAVSEDLHLDFKRGESLALNDGKKREMSKDVSAFANSDGGVIVYGIDEGENGEAAAWAPPSDPKVSVDWIDNVLQQNISPKIDGLRIHAIAAPCGGSAFVVTVPAAVALAPHQAADHRYYRRFERSSVPMEDYEVRRLFNRKIAPDLSLASPWARAMALKPLSKLGMGKGA